MVPPLGGETKMEGGSSNKDKLFFKLYEYINKLDNLTCDDINLEKEGRKKVLYISKKSKGKNISAHEEVIKSQVKGEEKLRESKIKDATYVEGGVRRSGPFDVQEDSHHGSQDHASDRQDGGSYTSSCSSSYSSEVDEAESAPQDFLPKAEKDEKGDSVNVHSYSHTERKKKKEKTKKKKRNTSQRRSGQRGNGQRMTSRRMCTQRSDLLGEIENYYVISKLRRKMEEYKSVNDIKIIIRQGNSNLLGMVQNIDGIINGYKKIKDELDKVEKNKQYIYDTFYSIFLNYYSRYEELKIIKGNKRRVERHLKFYTNVDHFEKVLNHMEKNEYAYFIEMHNNSLKKNARKEYAGEVRRGGVLEMDDQSDYDESETDSGDEGEMEMDNWAEENIHKWVTSYGTEGGDTDGEEKRGEDERSYEIDNYLPSVSEKEEEVSLTVGGYATGGGQDHDEGGVERGILNGGIETEKSPLDENAGVDEKQGSNKYVVQRPNRGVCAMRGNSLREQLRNHIWWAKKMKRRISAGGTLNGVGMGGGHSAIDFASNGGVPCDTINQARRGKTKRRSENEICQMLHFSEKAIMFFKKNGTYLHAKAKLNKYQSIIRRILKYVINLFRDVLNNAELNIPDGRGGESLGPYGTSSFDHNCKEASAFRELSCRGEWWDDSTLRRDNPIGGKDLSADTSYNTLSAKRLHGEDNYMNNFKSDNMRDTPERINDEKDEVKNTQQDEIANLREVQNLSCEEDEMEDNQIYKNISMIYFSKYINELEYYKKFKIKCSCMRDVIYFIYEKTLVDENNLYTEEYNNLENIYVSTRVKLLNSNVLSSNVLSNFEYLLKSDVCKYIRNVCLLAMYVSKLEVDLYTYIFNNNLNNSVNIILNNIGLCIFDYIHDCIHQLNNIQLIRKIIRTIYVDIIDTYSDNSYRIICDYLRKICKILKDKLLYVIEVYISYYTKNTSASLPYVCFHPLRKKFINIVNNFLYDEYLLTGNAHTEAESSLKIRRGAPENEEQNGQVNSLFFLTGSNNLIDKSVPSGGKSEPVGSSDNGAEAKPMSDDPHNVGDPSRESTSSMNIVQSGNSVERGKNIDSGNSVESVDSRDSLESFTSGSHAVQSECNKNVLNEKDVYKPFSFHRREFNKDSEFGLCGIDLNIIGTILILKTINFIIDEETLLELFRECLENSYNSITFIYKEHMKNHPQDMFNGALYLIKNLSLLVYLFFKVTKDSEFLRFYLHRGLTEQLLFGESPKEWIMENYSGNVKKEGDKVGAENENSILYFFKRVYNMSSQNDIQNRILAAFNDAIYNFTVATVSRVCFPLIKILSMEYKECAIEKEEEIKKTTQDFLNAKRSCKSDLQVGHEKVEFSFLREINFDLLKEYAEKVTNERSTEAANCSNLDDVKKSLQSFKQNVFNLFPRIYFYVKLFIYSNTEKPKENDFFPGLFSHIVGLLTYKIVGLLSEVYLIIRLKYADQVEAIFEENYVNDIFLFLNSSERYICSFSDIHQYLDTNKNYSIWGE
ncbi:conserved Plasmodium protein, unknown function [Plasmodium knowlesi strain H]|uniref:Uncharacterized protein n=3 Tax=Plasmodium knowlesi TaxID=5850 RepID=A0A5K1V8I2_PLAKH|nr:conserved oligomeric Golgi complex subunit 3, putative [Plasmodium knowlesi strain H]OTN66315.1 Uncharacterized protein PKNOH_S09533300 [Plasmodium knowlesi]CAA9989974.1 conserved oligomeric Golgi complex subunit 3, putative [Plasmodium knowlesi strain H]SBO24561.1 conserved Plasmodium protein, unknown function [Plasmodium knowlesi strain H]SBO26333.1 conserved Plasmodium protein, unknown function [Plasmodium knowlesi strain H]VVS79448.1 conserved oligomeric Golgi complex subunit 3, putativ|eukprot:XP_002259989.1 hypothetical protein, conserved in Plasmodium species [Plasmodium knowlesi strain H]